MRYPCDDGIVRLQSVQDEDDSDLVATYVLAHFSEGTPHRAADPLRGNASTLDTIEAWITRYVDSGSGNGWFLEAGCGPGGLLRRLAGLAPRGVVGLDQRCNMLRAAMKLASGSGIDLRYRVEGNRREAIEVWLQHAPWLDRLRLVQGDALCPPFRAESFALVAACSLLDTVFDPVVCLGQLDALLAPGGLLVLATPWRWDERVTPCESWWTDGAAQLRKMLAGQSELLPHLRFDVVIEHPGLPWVLPGDARLSHRYALDVVVARKRG